MRMGLRCKFYKGTSNANNWGENKMENSKQREIDVKKPGWCV
jgi:hypothetical protein